MHEMNKAGVALSAGTNQVARPSARTRAGRTTFGALMVWMVFSALLALSTTTATAQSDSIRVDAGESIQAAVDSADEGTTIVVGEGVYEEQVRIRTNGITLQGEPGAIIRPGSAQATNDCSWLGLGSAVCVGTEFIPMTNPDWPEEPFPDGTIKNVTIAGLTIEGPAGFGIRVVDGKNINISDNVVSGVLAPALNVGSVKNFEIVRNSVDNEGTNNFTPLVFIGRSAKGAFKGNEIRNGAQNAVSITRARTLVFSRNQISGSCGGVFAGDAIRKLKLTRNIITGNNKLCQDPNVDGDIGGYGILLVDGSKITIRANTITDHVVESPTITPGGLLVTPAPGAETGPKRVTIANNTITGNSANGVPLDLFADGVPKLRVLRNTCEVSLPDASWCAGTEG